MAVQIGEIASWDKKTQAQMDKLLLSVGIRRDGHLDYSCGAFEDGELVATGSSFHNTLRCMAVSPDHQGEGLMNQVVYHLLERQVMLGNSHVFMYTKPQSAKMFGDLGFYEIARLDDVVFMENRKDGFRRWVNSLVPTRKEGRCAAIVMNANPFTKGHRRLVETAAGENDFVHLFLLSEEAGPIPFAVRRRLVQEGIADLPNVIYHDSGPYIISSATFPSYFLPDGDAAILAHAKLDLRLFGEIAKALNITRRYVGEERSSHVTVLYNQVMSTELPAAGVEFHEIPRLALNGEVVSASTVRQAIHDGRLPDYAYMLPETSYRFFLSDEAAPINAAIRRMADPRHY
ncbi:MAG: [Oscillospiraceae bacterium]|nr:[citrate (pro-3S)-lyase] ligase [Oscillospiraceae bacterium]